MASTRFNTPHQYIGKDTGEVITERLIADGLIGRIYCDAREKAPDLYRALTSLRMSSLLGLVNYDLPMGSRVTGAKKLVEELGIDLSECVDSLDELNTPRKLFERRIRYWETRPLPEDPATVVSPADSKALVGSLAESSQLYLKGKFFDFEELIGPGKRKWLNAFDGGDYAVFRLTPEKYHYNHTPVSGRVVDAYEITGACHSCNPGAVVEEATPYSKNKRAVAVFDTDVEGGTGVGLVLMVEVVALMIGGIQQCYSEQRYDAPRPLRPGDFAAKGQPKSLYRPGSSVDVLLFEPGRVDFHPGIVANLHRAGVQSRFSSGFGKPLVETEVALRSLIATARR